MNIQNIILISSAHQEEGELNSNELYKILVKINPEVIFEELPFPRTKENIIKFNIKSIESLAIDRYIDDYNVAHVSVDFDFLFILDEINSIYEILFKAFENNDKYRSLNLRKNYSINKYGFKYLNSDECLCILDEIKSIEKDIIIELNNIKLSCLYNLLGKINKKRENEMVEKIFEYSIKMIITMLFLYLALPIKNLFLKILKIIKINTMQI